jgi:ParB/RepB/Spo0J family partition protein
MKQASLLPSEPLEFEALSIALGDLPVHPVDPSDAFVANVKANGVLEPILVYREGREYRLSAGRRRLAAARLAGLKEIPALCFDRSKVNPASITLAENLQRTRNPSSEVAALRAIIREGMSEKEIAEAAALPVAEVRERLRVIQSLDVVLLDAFCAGKLSASVARSASRLSKSKQARVVKMFESGETLNAGKVRALTKTTQEAIETETEKDLRERLAQAMRVVRAVAKNAGPLADPILLLAEKIAAAEKSKA